jgi:DNA-binding NarL/FixJ family response regulator
MEGDWDSKPSPTNPFSATGSSQTRCGIKSLLDACSRVALTERELQILKLAAGGLRNKKIGAALKIAEDTVKIISSHL